MSYSDIFVGRSNAIHERWTLGRLLYCVIRILLSGYNMNWITDGLILCHATTHYTMLVKTRSSLLIHISFTKKFTWIKIFILKKDLVSESGTTNLTHSSKSYIWVNIS